MSSLKHVHVGCTIPSWQWPIFHWFR